MKIRMNVGKGKWIVSVMRRMTDKEREEFGSAGTWWVYGITVADGDVVDLDSLGFESNDYVWDFTIARLPGT